MNAKTKRLTTTGVLIALGTILSLVKVFEWFFGGSITLASMVPLCVLGYMYGVKWGLFSGFIFSVIQAILGATSSQAFAGMYDSENPTKSVLQIVAMALLDYIVAFSVIGLSGMFKNKIKNPTASIALGSGVAVLLRLAAHFLSGFILWGSYAEWFFTDVMANGSGEKILNTFSGNALAALYSLIYNAAYMIPELIITVVVVVVLMSVKPLRKYIVNTEA
ncbi:MAG: energy-coupled thiamine transporter ThiT [Eubacterium sp.]|nr:energy-coupled thiamine transporter ThiT [Eubacterium sp.]